MLVNKYLWVWKRSLHIGWYLAWAETRSKQFSILDLTLITWVVHSFIIIFFNTTVDAWTQVFLDGFYNHCYIPYYKTEFISKSKSWEVVLVSFIAILIFSFLLSVNDFQQFIWTNMSLWLKFASSKELIFKVHSYFWNSLQGFWYLLCVTLIRGLFSSLQMTQEFDIFDSLYLNKINCFFLYQQIYLPNI